MRTRSSSNQIVESSTIPRRRDKRSQQQVVPTIVEIPVVTMANNRKMEEMLQAHTEGYRDAIVVPNILAENFEIRTGLLLLIQANQFYGFESNNPHDHIRSFNRITSTLKFRNVPNDAIKLMLFPYSLEGAAKICNTIANPKGDLTAITTRSGVSYDGPPIPPHTSSLSKVVERVPETTKDMVQPSTKNIQPLVVQTQVPIDEPIVAPKPKPTIPYPLRANKQNLCEKDDNPTLKIAEIFRKLHFYLSFAYALLHMPKFALMFKSLLDKKEKLFDLATTPVNENCSAVILKKFPKKLGDPGKFLIPCDFPELVECLALADLGASINLIPLSIWKKLSLLELTPTRMILELADRSTTRPAGIAEDVFVKVGKFRFPTDFVVVYYVVDPRVLLILGRPFLRIEQDLIDVYGEELTLCVDDEAITFKVGQTSKYSYNDAESINRIDVIGVACEEYVQEGGDFILEEIKACLTSKSILLRIDDTNFDLERDIRLIEKLLNDDPSSSPLPLKELNVEEIKTVKSSIDEPPELDLKDLPSHLEYTFLEGTDKLPIIISKELKDEEKFSFLKVLKSHKQAIAWKIYDIKGTFQRYMMASFYDMIEETMEVFMDDFLEKCNFMVKEGIVLGHKISNSGIEVERAKVDVIAKLPHPTSIKGAENLAADHLSRLENPHQDELEKKEITQTFPLETLGMIAFCGDSITPWNAPDLEASRARGFVHPPLELQILYI
nr:reverse transcriptase domain-containing protein [Tanacetum cinerariifolium]